MTLSNEAGVASRNDVAQLLSSVENTQQDRQTACIEFLRELLPILDAARRVDRELDFHIAHRFNALRYLRHDELGLSKIIADLLDPAGDHGQGDIYLGAMLELLSVIPEGSESSPTSLAGVQLPAIDAVDRVHVELERTIKDLRRIDILVELRLRRGKRYCLAFENKPYAGDQYEQCKDYLEFLEREYQDRFLLVYVPAGTWMPTEKSLPNPKSWIHHFRVLPYVSIEELLYEDTLSEEPESKEDYEDTQTERTRAENTGPIPLAFRLADNVSLAEWFSTCSTRSNAERMRWFLNEAKRFCQQQFGDSTMTDTDVHYINKHLNENPQLVDSAYAVARAWPNFFDRLCEEFFDQMSTRMEREISKLDGELIVRCRNENRGWARRITVYKDSWKQYLKGDETDHASETRSAIHLQFHANRTASEMGVIRGQYLENVPDLESDPQKRLRTRLKCAGFNINPNRWWLYLTVPKYSDWNLEAGNLAQEFNGGGGQITDYFVKEFCKLVENAFPVIDEVEVTES